MVASHITVEQVWLDYQTSLKIFLLSRVDSPEDTDDLLQDILIKVHSNISGLKSHDKLKPWLFQIANNTIMDFYRAKHKNRAIHSNDLWWANADANNEHELEKCVTPFINALPQKYRDLLSAIELHGQSQKDYAEKHNISYSTLKSRVQKGRMLLRNSFENCCALSLDSRGNIAQARPKTDKCSSC